jgi:branched-chain amino acid transport system ATP-binding protein
MLRLKDIDVVYGPVQAVAKVSLELPTGRLGTIVGANGAGKSSLLNAISGIVPLSGGQVSIDGERIDLVLPSRRRERGLAHVLEGHRVFGDQSVQANLQLGALTRSRVRANRKQIMDDIEAQYRRFPMLAAKRNQLAGTLSGGQQQMLAISAALMARPSYLLLDEPSLGLAPKLVDEVFELIATLCREGLTILLIEQRASRSLEISDFGWVMQRGAIVLSGPSSTLLGQIEVRDAYLGGDAAGLGSDGRHQPSVLE